jgi:hypothetical protein
MKFCIRMFKYLIEDYRHSKVQEDLIENQSIVLNK